MLRFAIISAGMWISSVALTYTHHRMCFPMFMMFEPCTSMQRGALFLNTTLQRYGLMAVGFAIDTAFRYLPPLTTKSKNTKEA